MNRVEKQTEIDRLQGKFVRSNLAVITEFTGMSVEEIQSVKRDLRGVSGELQVVKNSLAARASAGTHVSLLHDHFQGQTALALSYGDPAASAKTLKRIAEQQKKFKIKIGVMEGQLLDFPGLARLADLPARPVLYSQLVRGLQTPIVQLATGLNAILGGWVRALAAVHEKRVASAPPEP
jgi:large subunit ribosomal protein L10